MMLVILSIQLFFTDIINTQRGWRFIFGMQDLCLVVDSAVAYYATVATVPRVNVFALFDLCVLAKILQNKRDIISYPLFGNAIRGRYLQSRTKVLEHL